MLCELAKLPCGNNYLCCGNKIVVPFEQVEYVVRPTYDLVPTYGALAVWVTRSSKETAKMKIQLQLYIFYSLICKYTAAAVNLSLLAFGAI